MPGPVLRNPTPQWIDDPSVTDSALTQVLRALARAIGADDPQSQVMGLATTGIGAKAAKGLKAYHGSPHDFDTFSMEKIGTGEGAQAYGHGLYFAENEATAEAYRKSLSRGVTPRELRESGAPSLMALNRDRVKRGLDPVRPGKTYEVNIKADPESFLDWDKPLSQQPAPVQQALKDAGIVPHTMDEHWAAVKAGEQPFKPADPSLARTGAHIYRDLQSARASNAGMIPAWVQGQNATPAATEALTQAGIPGITYLDQGSRAAGEGSRNYVVFDDSIIDILRKYGMLPPAVAAAYQAHRPMPADDPAVSKVQELLRSLSF